MRLDSSLPEIGSFETPYEGREIVYWEDPRSLGWLARTPANQAFLKLARFFEPQCDKFMCGPASIAIVLNALKLHSGDPIPIDQENESFARRINPALPEDYRATFHRYTQRSIFCVQSDRIKPIKCVYGEPNDQGEISHGLNLKEMSFLLQAHGVRARIRFVTPETCEGVEDELSHALSTKDTYVIANFDRSVWGLKGGGHVSPLGAFDPLTRRALVVDVNACGRWLWIDVNLLTKSMMSKDGDFHRGFLIIMAL